MPCNLDLTIRLPLLSNPPPFAPKNGRPGFPFFLNFFIFPGAGGRHLPKARRGRVYRTIIHHHIIQSHHQSPPRSGPWWCPLQGDRPPPLLPASLVPRLWLPRGCYRQMKPRPPAHQPHHNPSEPTPPHAPPPQKKQKKLLRGFSAAAPLLLSYLVRSVLCQFYVSSMAALCQFYVRSMPVVMSHAPPPSAVVRLQ